MCRCTLRSLHLKVVFLLVLVQRGSVRRAAEHRHHVHSEEGEAVHKTLVQSIPLIAFPISFIFLLICLEQGMFEPHMKSFYVRSTDATHIKTLKVTDFCFIANYTSLK